MSSDTPEPKEKYIGNLTEIIRQLEACKYACQAGPLENNIAFMELKRMAGLIPDPNPLSLKTHIAKP